MAESISEGTLKQWSKSKFTGTAIDQAIDANFHPEIGDYVEQDEEIATIETDKVHMNLPTLRDVHNLTHNH